MTGRSAASEKPEKLIDRFLHVVGARVRLLIQPICLGVLLASVLILSYCHAQAAPAQHPGHVDQSVERIGIDFDEPVTDVSTFAPQLILYGIDNGVIFLSPIAASGEAVVDVRPEQKPQPSPKPDSAGSRSPDSKDIGNHWGVMFGVLIMFLSAFAGGLASDAARHGYKDTLATLICMNSLIMPHRLIVWARKFECERDGVFYEDRYGD